jgi:hypothetical protein
MSAEKILDRVHAAVAGTVDGRTQIWDVMLDLEVVVLRGQFAGSDDVAIEHSSVTPGFAVPRGGPYTVRYSYHGRNYEHTVWGDENGQLVAVKP